MLLQLSALLYRCWIAENAAQGSESRDTIKEKLGLSKYLDEDVDDEDDERILEVRPLPSAPADAR